jgi:hypothetical protein
MTETLWKIPVAPIQGRRSLQVHVLKFVPWRMDEGGLRDID